jgi:hypothetical protein
MAGAKRPWHAAGLLLLFVAGCGAQYRPVVTPVTPTGPASQPTAYFVAISSPSPTSAGLVTIVNAFGDTVVGQATLSNGPLSFTLNNSGSIAYNINSDATAASNTSGQSGSFVLNSYAVTVGTSSGGGIKTQNISTSTIPPLAYPFNALTTSGVLYLVEPYIQPSTMTYQQNPNSTAPPGAGFIGELTGTVPALQQEIQVAPNPVNLAGYSGAPRVFAISQGSTTGGPLVTPNACETPSIVATNGEADAIEVTTNTVSNRIPVGRCPVYGIMSPDYLRAYILNRGSGNITVINSQTNAIDTSPQVPSGTITVGGGPVYADLYQPSQLLVTANYDSNTVSVINVPTDIYQNDGPTFGTVKTIAVGSGPVALTILRDGSRAYVANQNDCTVSVVNLTSFVVTKTISLPFVTNAQNQSVACHPKAIASVYSTPAGTVFVASSDSSALTAINTETDTVSSSIQMPGNLVTVRSTTQNAANSVNAIVNSNSTGFGVPCATTDTSPFCPVVF